MLGFRYWVLVIALWFAVSQVVPVESSDTVLPRLAGVPRVRPPAPPEEPPLLVVLDFRNETGNRDYDWLSFAFAETLSDLLDSLAATLVLERTALSEPVDLKKLQEKHEVEVVVRGVIRHQGQRLVFSVEVTNVNKEQPPGAAEVSGALNDLFDLQEQMTLKVAALLKVPVSEEEKEFLRERPTKSLAAYRALTEAWQAHRQQRGDDARARARRALQEDPKYLEAYYFLRFILWEEGRLAEALEVDQKTVRSRPDEAEVHKNLSESYAAQGKMNEAFAAAKKALSLDADDPEFRLHIAHLYSLQGKYADALKEYRKLVDDDAVTAEEILGSLVERHDMQSPATWTVRWVSVDAMQLLAAEDDDIAAAFGMQMIQPLFGRHMIFAIGSQSERSVVPTNMDAVLRDHQGREFKPVPLSKGLKRLFEEEPGPGGVRTVAFSTRDAQGKDLITPNTGRLTLIVKDPNAERERVFTWENPAACLQAMRQLRQHIEAAIVRADPEGAKMRQAVAQTMGAVMRATLDHDPPMLATWLTPQFFAASLMAEDIIGEEKRDELIGVWAPLKQLLENNLYFAVVVLEEEASEKSKETLEKLASQTRLRDDRGREFQPDPAATILAEAMERGMQTQFPGHVKVVAFPKADADGNPMLAPQTKSITLMLPGGEAQPFTWTLPLKYPAPIEQLLKALNEGKVPSDKPRPGERKGA